MIKAIVYAISKVNDFKVLLLPNGEFAPMETTENLHLEDEIFIQNLSLGDVTFKFNSEICSGFIEDFCSLEIALTFFKLILECVLAI